MSNENEEYNELSISILDVKGQINNGVGLLLNLMIKDEAFELGYWFNIHDDIIISPEDKLLIFLDVEKIEEYEYFDILINFIHENIPNKDKIIEEYLK